MLCTCWLLFLHSAVQLLPIHLNCQVIVEAKSSDAAHHHSPSGQIALRQPGGVFWVIVLLINK